MPEGIYVNGNLPDPGLPAVAMVGARKCSSYGKAQAEYFAKTLAEYGVQIISGLAYGIDSYSHQGALLGKGRTFAVMGCGADLCYPRENQALYRKIIETGGGILSELPSGTPPRPWNFPNRNRLISALSDLVLIVEARERSGSLITADFALEQGKSVMAVPGRVNDALSEGCNRLLAQGAGVAWSVQAVLDELGISEKAEKRPFPKECRRKIRNLIKFSDSFPEGRNRFRSFRLRRAFRSAVCQRCWWNYSWSDGLRKSRTEVSETSVKPAESSGKSQGIVLKKRKKACKKREFVV